MEFVSEENLRNNGLILTRFFPPPWDEVESEYTLGGVLKSWNSKLVSNVGDTGLCVAEAEVPRLCSFPRPADERAAAKAPLLGDDLIFASGVPAPGLFAFGVLLYFQMLPPSPYIVDGGYAESVDIVHARLAGSDVCDDALLPMYCEESSNGLAMSL